MTRGFIVAVFVMYFVSISSVHAGTWRDDFEDGNLDGWFGVNASWNAEDGECSGEFFDAPSGMLELIVTGDAGWKDYTVECKMKFVATGHFAGISFRDARNRYGFVINTTKNTAWAWKVLQEVITEPSEVPLPFTVSKDTWYELKIVVEGDHFEFYTDGELACEFDDNSIPSGKVGLCVRNAHVHFDDVVITGPEIPDGDPGFAVTSQSKLATTWGSVKRCP